MIYLDYNATTPCDDEVLADMLPFFREKFGNASSKTHPYGWIADEAVERARRRVAKLIGAEAGEIIFTSGATESCNLAIKGIFELFRRFEGNVEGIAKKHIITCVAEHKAVLDTCEHLKRWGAEVTYLGVDTKGKIDLDELKANIRADTLLIAVMYANNETGIIQPVQEIAAIAKREKIIFFSDATQAVGKMRVDVNKDGIDALALSAHKIYGPKGVGALYIRRKMPRVRLAAQMDGGGHEAGFRSGTLNVPGIVGLGKAAMLCMEQGEREWEQVKLLRDELEEQLLRIDGAKVNGGGGERLPNVCNIAFKDIKAERLVVLLNTKIAFSLGSACTSAVKEPSHVLKAMGKSIPEIEGSVRLSLGRYTTAEETGIAAKEISEAVRYLEQESL